MNKLIIWIFVLFLIPSALAIDEILGADRSFSVDTISGLAYDTFNDTLLVAKHIGVERVDGYMPNGTLLWSCDISSENADAQNGVAPANVSHFIVYDGDIQGEIQFWSKGADCAFAYRDNLNGVNTRGIWIAPNASDEYLYSVEITGASEQVHRFKKNPTDKGYETTPEASFNIPVNSDGMGTMFNSTQGTFFYIGEEFDGGSIARYNDTGIFGADDNYDKQLLDPTNSVAKTGLAINVTNNGSIQFFYGNATSNRVYQASLNVSTPILPSDVIPPIIILINLTSEGGLGQVIDLNNKFSGQNKTNDTTPTFFVKTNEAAQCAVIDKNRDLNCTDIEAGGGTCSALSTTHTITLPSANKTGIGFHNFSIGCKDSFGNENRTSTSGLFTINITQAPILNPVLYLDGLNASRKYEYRTQANISAELTPSSSDQICIDLDAPNFGFNFSCGFGFTSFIYNINILRQSNFTVTGGDNISWCYQETATEATFCGGLATGAYGCEGTFSGSHPCEDGFDGDLSTYASPETDEDIFIFINYTKPSDAVDSSRFQFKMGILFGVLGGKPLSNFSLTNSSVQCWNSDPLQFRVELNNHGGPNPRDNNLSCWDGTDWKEIWSELTFQGDRFYEEAMWWNISTEILYQVNVKMDDRTQMVATEMNISSSGVTTNLNINYGAFKKILRGDIEGANLEDTQFIHSNSLKDAVNLTYITPGSDFIFANLSDVDNPINLTFQLSGFDLDANNEFTYTEFFKGSDGSAGFNETFTFHSDAPLGVFDDFTSNNSIWSYIQTQGNTPPKLSYTDISGKLRYEQGSSGEGSTTIESTIIYSDAAGDFRNSSKIEFLFDYLLSISECSPPITGGRNAFLSIRVTDGTSNVILKNYELPSATDSGATQLARQNFTLINKDYTNDRTWQLLINGSSQGNKDFSILDFTKQIKLQLLGRVSDFCGGGTFSRVDLNTISWSGAWLNRSTNNGTYKNEGNISSCVGISTDPLEKATLTATDYKPDQTDISYYLTNNNGTTLESVNSGITHAFDSDGAANSEVCWRAKLNSSINITSPIVRRVRIDVVKSAVENITVDLGDNGLIDFTFLGPLNSTTSPTFVNLSPRRNQLNTIKISSATSGIIQVDKFKVNSSINPIILNETAFENCENCLINFLFSGDEMLVNTVSFDFLGSWNYTAIARYPALSLAVNHTIQIFYSVFNVSLPKNIDFYDVFPSSKDSKNVTPFSQTSLTPIWNVTNLAYEESIDIYVKTNESLISCLNVTYANTSLRVASIINESFVWINGTAVQLANSNLVESSEIVFNQTSGNQIGTNNYTMNYVDGTITLNTTFGDRKTFGINYSYLVYGNDLDSNFTFKLNTSYQKILTNISVNFTTPGRTSKGIWNWWDLSNCSAQMYLPYVFFASQCSSCFFEESQLDNFNLIVE